MRIALTATIILLFSSISACSGGMVEPDISISDQWVRAAGMMDMAEYSGMNEDVNGETGDMPVNTAGYMRIENKGSQPDRLLRAESDIAEAVELHFSEMVDDVMKMRQVESIEVPPNSAVELKPGGYHIMFIGLMDTLDPGDNVEINLVFENFGELKVLAEVKAP